MAEITDRELLVEALKNDGYAVSIDSDGDPCFHVTRSEFSLHQGYEDSHYADILAGYGYRSAFQVVADRAGDTEHPAEAGRGE